MANHHSPEPKRNRRTGKILGPLWLFVLAPLWLPFLAIVALFHYTYSVILYLAIWLVWCRSGARALLVYSRSPHWQTHIENIFLPKLPSSTIVLNWSDRSTWPRWSLSVRAFNHFLGYREHTPSVIVFRPFRRAKVFRLFEAFQEFKHGNSEPLQNLETECLGICNAL